MSVGDKTVLITGANRGIGRALVEEALDRGARRVYAGVRRPIDFSDGRVTSLRLDITDAEQIRSASGAVGSLDVLINSAGLYGYEDLADRAALQRYLEVNFFGPYVVTQTFLPRLVESRGAIVNVLSLASLAALPMTPAYSISKAAAFSMTQSLRATLASHGVGVHCRAARAGGHRHGARPRYPQGVSTGRSPSHLRGTGARRRRHLPGPLLADPRRELAHRRGEGAEAPERLPPADRTFRCLTRAARSRPWAPPWKQHQAESPAGQPSSLGASRGLGLVGSTRAQLLMVLDEPLSTRDLSRRYHWSEPTVSYHLKVLERSRLVAVERRARWVLYRQTLRGAQLLGR